MSMLVYFSSGTQNTHRFITKTELPAQRISCSMKADLLQVTQPFVLVLATYAGGDGRGAVPKPVIRFLNDSTNRSLIRGVIASGNRNFGTTFGIAGDVISEKCQVPFLYRYELAGTEDDVMNVRTGLKKFWAA
ncbi:class Ib ribonucleoside-diphosphate reductase assembly flavoprotein NrdI [Pseudochrobactrum sp. sp1633]|uniref:class Ib ribonucleoside-diphosphate reductase assembly flavoprotein NrdI n=1 Tax=Pseudochrobactrum sp. sp1633 TaxID=3036706 RepID=UPI0025A55136|nr:class Ib ribonucleoside-diphosphate reductase assembly flavoprotein NrdI [Pseudochrobactrum sp. sp1633]MDM8344619.1 class Ib ribonucleoside-diphosphate reductase assembly flavoprotein NrdI [Pseudochrobactrum sp. sp1633]HWD13621.1 class Ib ribonucleoside-diphosphate reductase assembly flavoprotein NrdI [Pseudochrobactrum sp.]